MMNFKESEDNLSQSIYYNKTVTTILSGQPVYKRLFESETS